MAASVPNPNPDPYPLTVPVGDTITLTYTFPYQATGTVPGAAPSPNNAAFYWQETRYGGYNVGILLPSPGTGVSNDPGFYGIALSSFSLQTQSTYDPVAKVYFYLPATAVITLSSSAILVNQNYRPAGGTLSVFFGGHTTDANGNYIPWSTNDALESVTQAYAGVDYNTDFITFGSDFTATAAWNSVWPAPLSGGNAQAAGVVVTAVLLSPNPLNIWIPFAYKETDGHDPYDWTGTTSGDIVPVGAGCLNRMVPWTMPVYPVPMTPKTYQFPFLGIGFDINAPSGDGEKLCLAVGSGVLNETARQDFTTPATLEDAMRTDYSVTDYSVIVSGSGDLCETMHPGLEVTPTLDPSFLSGTLNGLDPVTSEVGQPYHFSIIEPISDVTCLPSGRMRVNGQRNGKQSMGGKIVNFSWASALLLDSAVPRNNVSASSPGYRASKTLNGAVDGSGNVLIDAWPTWVSAGSAAERGLGQHTGGGGNLYSVNPNVGFPFANAINYSPDDGDTWQVLDGSQGASEPERNFAYSGAGGACVQGISVSPQGGFSASGFVNGGFPMPPIGNALLLRGTNGTLFACMEYYTGSGIYIDEYDPSAATVNGGYDAYLNTISPARTTTVAVSLTGDGNNQLAFQNAKGAGAIVGGFYFRGGIVLIASASGIIQIWVCKGLSGKVQTVLPFASWMRMTCYSKDNGRTWIAVPAGTLNPIVT